MAALRVLQVVGDTDDTDDARFALDLHDALVGSGLEVRTMALGPGRSGGLEPLVPVMSPSRRSIAAHTQLRREERWADVVVLRGRGPGTVAALSHRGTGGPPTVMVPGEDADGWGDVPVPSRVRKLADRGAVIVVTHQRAAVRAATALGRDPHDVVVVPVGVDLRPPVTSAAQRAAARGILGLPQLGVVVRRVDGQDRRGTTTLRRAADAAGVTVVHAGAGDPEVVAAAADVAVLVAPHSSGPPRGLLLAGRDGDALVAPPEGAVADLVDDTTGVPVLTDPSSLTAALALLADDPASLQERGHAAAERVRERYGLADVAARWEALLRRTVAASAT